MDRLLAKIRLNPLYYGLVSIASLAGLLTLFFVINIWSHYSEEGHKALSEGKRVVISVAENAAVFRKPNPDELPPDMVADETPTEEMAEASPEETTETLPTEETANTPEEETAPTDVAETPEETPSEESAATEETPAETAPTEDGTLVTPEIALPADLDLSTEHYEPLDPKNFGKLAVIIRGLGLNQHATQAAIQLPPQVALSFSAYAYDIDEWATGAVNNGHPFFIDLPVATTSYPRDDPGPLALILDSGKAKNIFRLNSIMEISSGYSGLLLPPDEDFTHSFTAAIPVLQELQGRKKSIIYKENMENGFVREEVGKMGIPAISYYVVLDAIPSASYINKIISDVNRQVTREKKNIVVVGEPYPVTIKHVETWIKRLQTEGFEISPIEDIMALPPENMPAPAAGAPADAKAPAPEKPENTSQGETHTEPTQQQPAAPAPTDHIEKAAEPEPQAPATDTVGSENTEIPAPVTTPSAEPETSLKIPAEDSPATEKRTDNEPQDVR